MHRLQTLLAGLVVACLAIPLHANRPTDPPDGADAQGLSASKSGDPYQHGLKNLRRLTLDDLSDPAQDLWARQPKLSGHKNVGDDVAERLNKRLRDSRSAVRVTRIERDKIGILHIRLSQLHRGIPVVGSDMIVHIDNGNAIVAVSGAIAPLLDVDTEAPLGASQARDAAIRSVVNGSRSPRDSSKLVIFDDALAYEVIVDGTDEGPTLFKCYIDAKTGEVLYKADMIITAGPGPSGTHEPVSGTRLSSEDGSVVSMTGWHNTGGNYFLYNKDSLWGVYNIKTADWEQRTASSWETSDPAAVSLAKNFAITQDYARKVMGMNSFDNAGTFARANVHEGTNLSNAYWDGADCHFGDGNGTSTTAYTVLDVAAHEYGHAVTHYSSDLVYSYESGALNESFSDILGTLVEFWAQPDGRSSYPNRVAGASDWLHGEDCRISQVAGRDMRNPQRFYQPSYYKGKFWYTGSGDNGGVHYNSGVQNFAFYLAAEGGSGSNNGHPYSITGLGIQAAGEIAMYVNRYLLTSSSQYLDARDAWISAATVLGYSATTVTAVWTACGVLPSAKYLSVYPETIDFGSVGVGLADTAEVTLSNNGALTTTVSELTFSDSWFKAIVASPFMVPGGGTYFLKIACSPTEYATRTGTMTIFSDAEDNPVLSIGLSGTGVAPAAIAIDPMFLHENVSAGDSVKRIIECANSGSVPLKIRISKIDNERTHATMELDPAGYTSVPPSRSDSGAFDSNGSDAHESAIAAFPWYDGFEKGNLDNWTPGSGSYIRSVTNQISANGKYSFLLKGGSFGSFDGVSAAFASPQQPNDISFSIRIANRNVNQGYFVLCGENGAEIIRFYMTSRGEFYANGRSDYYFIANQWYDIRFELNWPKGNFKFYVNDTLLSYPATPFTTNTPITALHLFNSNNSSVWWDNINIGGKPDNSWLTFSIDTATILPGQTLSIPLVLNPKGFAGGNNVGSLLITHNAPATVSPLVVPCTLTVHELGKLSVNPAEYSFGSVWIGHEESALFTLTNSGPGVTRITSMASDNPAFTVATAFPLDVPPNESISIPVAFLPSTVGSFTGTLSIASNATDNPVLTVNLSGNGASAPKAHLAPTSLVYSLLRNDDPVKKTSILSNTGSEVLSYSITAEELSRPDNGKPGLPWLSISPAAGSLAPGSAQALTITVDPTECAAGQWVGGVIVASNDPVTPKANVSITATISECKKLSCSPQTLDFKTVQTGVVKQLTLTLTSGCIDEVTVSALNFSTSIFSSTAAPPFQIGPFGSREIPVSCAPIVPGPVAGKLTLASDAIDNPACIIDLTGTAVTPPQIVLEPQIIRERLRYGAGTIKTLTVYNTGGDDLLFSSATIDQTAAGTEWLSIDTKSGVVAPGSSASLSVTILASALPQGTYSGSIRFTHNDPSRASPLDVPVFLLVTTSGGLRCTPLFVGISAYPLVKGSSYRIKNLRMGENRTGVLKRKP